MHHRVETNEEREGRIQKARWTHLKPDHRVKESIHNEKPEELILLHEDDVHYNIIVHKSVNNFKEHIKEDHREMTTIFGETNGKMTSKSWAQVTKVCRPGYLDPHHEINTDAKIGCSEESQNLDCSTSDDLGKSWKKRQNE